MLYRGFMDSLLLIECTKDTDAETYDGPDDGDDVSDCLVVLHYLKSQLKFILPLP